MGEVINNGETGTGGVVRTEKQTTQEEVQAVTEAVVTTIDNVATKKSMAEDRFTTAAEVQTGGGTKPTSNQASEVEEVENQITEDRTTADMSEVETMTTVAEEGEYTAEEHSVEGETVGDVVEEKTETTSDTRTDTGAVGGEEGGTTDGLTKSPMTAVAAEEGYRAEKYPLEEELTEDAVGHTMEAPILTDMEPTGATMTTAAEEEPFKTDEFSMEAITTEEKAEEGTETSTVADVELTDVLGMGGSATDYGVSATDAVGDEVIATTDDISDALVRKDDMAAMGMEENYISDTYPAEAETTKEVVKVTTEFPALTDEELTDAAITTAAEEEPYTMKKGTETPAGTGETTEEVGEGTTEAPVATAIELMNARTTGFGMTDTTEEEVWANTDDEKEETTEAESTVEGGLYPEGVDPMTTIVSEEDHTTGVYPVEAETTKEFVEVTTELPVLTDLGLTDATVTTAAEGEPYTTEKGIETSADMDAELVDAINMGSSATDYGVSTTDAVGDEVTAVTEDLSGALVKKDAMTTMGAERDYATEAYPLEEETTEGVFESTTEAPVATAIELMGATTTESGMTDATEEEVKTTPDGEKEETTEAESTVKGGLYTEGVDPMTTMVSEEDHTTAAYTLEEETTKEFVEVTTEAPVLTDTELIDATMTTAAEEEPYTTEKGTETSADKDAMLTDALIVEDPATDHGVSTTDAVGDEVTATTDHLSDMLVKKGDMTTMGAEEGSTTDAYPLEDKTTENGVEDTTEAPVATDIELMDTTTIESGMTGAIEEEVWATPDGEKEETTEAESTVKGGLYSEGVDPMTTIVSDEDHATGGYPLEEETNEGVVEITTEAPVSTNMEFTNAVDVKGLTSGAIEGELGITTAGLTVALATKANVNERTAENMDLQDSGSHSENVKTMT
ncbi:Zonadhesin, partial [Taenia solium]